MFAGTFRLQLAGYSGGKIIASALILAISRVLLLAGDYLGGALTFVYGVRVLKRPQAPMTDAPIPVAPTIVTDACSIHRCRPPRTAPVSSALVSLVVSVQYLSRDTATV
jgi:hypothetical protein